MTSDDIKTPRPGRLLLVGAAALVFAGAVAAHGLIGRAHSAQAVAQWTDQQAIPTVALAKLVHDSATQSLTLPGTIQAFNKAPIYARVSGYLKNWQQDIGAHVKAGQVLASIDTPDLDQQLAQAQADLATATANANLAEVTAGRWTSLAEPIARCISNFLATPAWCACRRRLWCLSITACRSPFSAATTKLC
jgi:multidrug efflux pump subunit AcrA (membrane-fusion protein)